MRWLPLSSGGTLAIVAGGAGGTAHAVGVAALVEGVERAQPFAGE